MKSTAASPYAGLYAEDRGGIIASYSAPALWVDLSPYWSTCLEAAAKRDGQKSLFQSSRYWRNDSHFTGLLAEHVYGEKIGQKPNLELLLNGDRGSDFPDTDIKGCTYWRDPWLKHPAEKGLAVGKYILVALDIEQKRGYVVGYATRDEMKNAMIRDWGHGPQRSIPASSLHTCNFERTSKVKFDMTLELVCECRSFQYPHYLKAHERLRSDRDWRKVAD